MKEKKTLLKAYENEKFLSSADARTLRILAEYFEPQARFRKNKIVDTIVFFGSARLRALESTQSDLDVFKTMDPKHDKFAQKLRVAQHAVEMSRYYEDAVELSKKITEWTMSLKTFSNRFIICTGGGPGIMEAANKGAKLAGGPSIGLNISIPFEQFVNQYVSRDLSFEFHYFFMRKFWFAYLAKALIIFPGGFGTMDELFEILTLIQTEKIKKKLLIIIYDEKYWKKVINFDALADYGVISPQDMDLMHFCNRVDDAFLLLKRHFEENYLSKVEKDTGEPNLNIKE